MMKKWKLGLMALLLAGQTQAGDTTVVRVHDNVDLTWYGEKSEYGVFPDGSQSYRQILMLYTMGCASGGCSDWDYTTRIDLKHNTGEIDTVVTEYPMFTVDGIVIDTNYVNTDTSYTTAYNSDNKGTDTLALPALSYVFYNDAENPNTPTDTMYYWPGNYYNYAYDTNGTVVDSAWVGSDLTTIVDYHRDSVYNPVYDPFEMGRVITPYGGYMRTGQQGYDNSWKHTYVFDVTDFAPYLKDSVLIGAFYEGWSSGFSVTLDFVFITGTPPRNTLSIQNLYNGGYGHSNATDFEQNKWKPTKLRVHADAVTASIKSTITGHGFDNNTNCAEFCEKDYDVYVDLQKRFTSTIWDDQCGENPIYPQAGTWIYDRANWCPGGKGAIQEFEITPFITPGKNTWFDFNLETYSWSGNQAPSYNTDALLFCYGAHNFQLDASMVSIRKPNMATDYQRFNPICGGNPEIEIKNLGAQSLSSIEVVYGVKGGSQKTYTWNGDLDFNETATIQLPSMSFPDDWNGTEDIFEVRLQNPNGGTDENPDNDFMQSAFESVPEYSNHFLVQFRTNNRGYESAWEIRDSEGNVKYSRNNMASNTTYRDTVYLDYGCYEFYVSDVNEDGLVFPNDPNAGSGSVKFARTTGPGNVATFPTNFGSHIIHHFTVSNNVGVEELNQELLVEAYPNPSNGLLQIEMSLAGQEQLVVELINSLGAIVYQQRINVMGAEVIPVDMRNFANGIYTLRVVGNEHFSSQKIVLQQ